MFTFAKIYHVPHLAHLALKSARRYKRVALSFFSIAFFFAPVPSYALLAQFNDIFGPVGVGCFTNCVLSTAVDGEIVGDDNVTFCCYISLSPSIPIGGIAFFNTLD